MKRRVPTDVLAVAVALLSLAMGLPAAGQTITVVGSPQPERLGELVATVNQTLGLRDSALFELPIEPRAGVPILAFVPTPEAPLVLDLRPASVRSDAYRLFVTNETGSLVPAAPGANRVLRGEALAIPGSVVAGSMLDDGLHLRVQLPDGRDLWIEPIGDRVEGAGPFDYVIYDDEDVLELGLTCGADAAHGIGADIDRDYETAEGAGGNCIAELACDADFEFFSARGSVSSVEAWINNIVATINVQYERDVDITHVISTIVVRNNSNDPYNNSKNASSLLNQFRSEWETNQTGTWDAAQLFTGRDLAGSTIGIAWVGSVCTSFRYSLVQSLFNGNDPSPDACATDLSAHELGHNWGAGHCSCTNPPFTMNSFIVCANVFSAGSINAIVAHRDSRNCLDNCGGGTPTGACCTGATCTIETAADCSAMGGAYQGDGVGCSPDPCGGTPTGACCVVTTCTIETAADCAAAGGTYLGDGSDCSGNPCDAGGGDAIVDCIIYDTRGGPQQNKHLDVTVVVVDGTGAAVANASVSMTLSRVQGGSWNFGGTTDGAGEVTFSLLSAADGCYSSDVTAITGVGTFDGSEPLNGFDKSPGAATPDEDCRSASDGC